MQSSARARQESTTEPKGSAMSKLDNFRVTFEVDVEAASPTEAAAIARDLLAQTPAPVPMAPTVHLLDGQGRPQKGWIPDAIDLGDTIKLSIQVENFYPSVGDIVNTFDNITVPAPPPLDKGRDALEEWAWDHIFPYYTGTGRPAGPAIYTVKVTDSPSGWPVVGETWEWGA